MQYYYMLNPLSSHCRLFLSHELEEQAHYDY
jgi:hypothetical protein